MFSIKVGGTTQTQRTNEEQGASFVKHNKTQLKITVWESSSVVTNPMVWFTEGNKSKEMQHTI